MASIVRMQSPSEMLTCLAGEERSITFRVTNTSGLRRRIGYQVIAQTGEQSWFSAAGQQELLLVEAGEEAVTLKLCLPAGIQAESISFKLLVFDAAEPGEHFDESETVVVTRVRDAAPKPLPPDEVMVPRRRPWTRVLQIHVGFTLVLFLALILAVLIDEGGSIFNDLGDLGAALFLCTLVGLFISFPARLGRPTKLLLWLSALIIVPSFFLLLIRPGGSVETAVLVFMLLAYAIALKKVKTPLVAKRQS